VSEKIKGRNEGSGQCQRKRGQDGDTNSVEMLRGSSDETAVKWVFHRGPDLRWRWQKTSVSKGVLAQSNLSYGSYCDCLSGAKSQGYKEWLPPAKLTPLSFSHVPGLFQKPGKKSAFAAPELETVGEDSTRRSDMSTTNRGVDSTVVSLRRPGAT
jgi:hypothetical protein